MMGRLVAVPGAFLIAIAAALWGTDALLRKPLAESTEAATIVFGEHLVLVLIMLPVIPAAFAAVMRAGPALRAGRRGDRRRGVGDRDDPLHAGVRARRPRHAGRPAEDPAAFCGGRRVVHPGRAPAPEVRVAAGRRTGGRLGCRLPFPFEVQVDKAYPALLAITAAALWAMGTVLGRLLATRLRFQHVTALRFSFGLPASALAVLLVGAPFTTSASDFAWIAALAIVTGLVSLSLYYMGLRKTPATIAALAELTFPVTAAAVGYFAFDATLDGTQWLGVAVTTTVVLLLPVTGPRVVTVPRREPVPVTT